MMMMTNVALGIFLLAVGYLGGSLSSAIIVCRLARLPDPRTQGSGNPGTTNVLRLGGKKLAACVLLGDLFKGLLPVLLAAFIAHQTALLPVWLVLTGLAAIVGHLWPVFFGFQGGKGVATTAGVLLALSWPLALAVILTWLIVVAITRYSSLGALVATLLVPVYGLWLARPVDRVWLVVISILILWRHKDNIQRLLSGTETKIGRSR